MRRAGRGNPPGAIPAGRPGPTQPVLCTGGAVRSLVELSLTAEHRRGHGGLYDGINRGRIEVDRLRRTVTALPLPRCGEGAIVLAVDISAWLRPDAPTSPQRSFCHVYGRGKGQAQPIPGWQYSLVAALEPGRTSWTAVLDAVRLHPDDDPTAVTAAQIRDVVERLREAGQHRGGDPDILLIFDGRLRPAPVGVHPDRSAGGRAGPDARG